MPRLRSFERNASTKNPCSNLSRKGILFSILFVCVLMYLMFQALNMVLSPESFPTEIVFPNRSVFRKIEKPNGNIPLLYPLADVQKQIKVRRIEKALPTIKEKINALKDRLIESSSPEFPYDPNTTGIITTCRINAICVANLHHLFDTLKVPVPVG